MPQSTEGRDGGSCELAQKMAWGMENRRFLSANGGA